MWTAKTLYSLSSSPLRAHPPAIPDRAPREGSGHNQIILAKYAVRIMGASTDEQILTLWLQVADEHGRAFGVRGFHEDHLGFNMVGKYLVSRLRDSITNATTCVACHKVNLDLHM